MTIASILQRADALGQTLQTLRQWLAGTHTLPLPAAELEQATRAVADLENRLLHLQNEPTLLTVALLGGTGVGKSSLLNALAGDKIAESGIARPTTHHPTVYHHRDVTADRLPAVLRQCRLVSHDRPALRQKLLVDTPDMDSTVPENHDRLKNILPIADTILYVGSQEKYHDRAAWDMLLQYRHTQAFAFVLNKWDRCQMSSGRQSGVRPDEDFKRSLKQAGFSEPLLFRTCAAHWVLQRLNGAGDGAEELDDDFLRLEQWLEAGLNERAVRDIKTRGVTGKLQSLIDLMRLLMPPAWQQQTQALKQEWQRVLQEAVSEHAEFLVEAIDPKANELEAYFARVNRSGFRGIFAAYLAISDQLFRLLQPKLLVTFNLPSDGPKKRLGDLAIHSIASMPTQVREQEEMLRHHLLAAADRLGWPTAALESFLPRDERFQFGAQAAAQILAEGLEDLEREFVEPHHSHLWLQRLVRGLCQWLPPVVLVLIVLKIAYDLFFQSNFWGIFSLVGVAVVYIAMLVGLQFLLSRWLPMQWRILRQSLRHLLEQRLTAKLAPVYLQRLDEFSKQVAKERTTLTEPLELLEEAYQQLQHLTQPGDQTSLFAEMAPVPLGSQP